MKKLKEMITRLKYNIESSTTLSLIIAIVINNYQYFTLNEFKKYTNTSLIVKGTMKRFKKVCCIEVENRKY